MHVALRCPQCQQSIHAEVASDGGKLHCDACLWDRPIEAGDLQEGTPQRCLACGCNDLWRQKDFPQDLGLALVALGAILSTIAWACYMPQTALGILLAFAFADLLVYTFMPDVLVCYRCKARHKNAPLDQDHPRFNLETAERYRQEAARLAKHSLPGPS